MTMEYLDLDRLGRYGACTKGINIWQHYYGNEHASSEDVARAISNNTQALRDWQENAGWLQTYFPKFYEEVMSQYTPNRIRMPRERLSKVESKVRKIELEISRLDMEISELQRIRYALSQSLDVLRD